MPTLLTRTFALLNNIKPPTTESTLGDTNEIELSNESTLNKYTSTPDISIWKAAEQGDLSALQYYVHHTSVDPITLLNTRDPDTDCTLLHLAVSSSHNKSKNSALPIVKFLLEHRADATARNIYNVQAIHMVSLHCPQPLPCIELLLNHKASPNARDGDGWTPLHYAARFCQPPDLVLQLLVSQGGDINLTDAGHKSPLFGLLANGDLTTALDWLIHTAKADVSIRGDFLDQASRKTRPGTIVLQAAKYGRLDCLQLLIKSTTAMNQLRRVIHRDELNHANFLVKEQLQRTTNPSESQKGKFELILSLLQELEDMLEKDPLSLLNSRKLNGSSTLPVSLVSNKNNTIQRRHTLLTMFDSIRSKRKSAVNRTDSSTKGGALFRKVSRMIRRTKSENMTSTGVESTTSRQQPSENRSAGLSR
ncbi:unnamed protein product [Mucor hiemalis]